MVTLKKKKELKEIQQQEKDAELMQYKLKDLAEKVRILRERKEEIEQEEKQAKLEAAELMTVLNTPKVQFDGVGSFVWKTTPPRKTLDKELLQNVLLEEGFDTDRILSIVDRSSKSVGGSTFLEFRTLKPRVESVEDMIS